MNNGLGINFFRYLKEEDEQFWVQVFAKLPFDDIELSQKGALFGVVRLKKTDDWSEVDMEMTSWVDEYYNGLEMGINLADFYIKFKDKYSLVDGVWMSVVGDNKKRTLKVVGVGAVSYLIKRSGSKIDLSKSLDSRKVLSGELKCDDEVDFGVGGLDLREDDSLENINLISSYGYFKLQITNLVDSAEEVLEKTETAEVITERIEPVIDVRGSVKPDIASNKYIGKLGLRSRLKNLLSRGGSDLSVNDEDSRKNRKKRALFLGLFFVGVLVVSLVLGGIKKRSELSERKWIEFSDPIEKTIVSAVGITKINPSGAKKMIDDARQKFNAGKGEFDDTLKLGELEKKIDDSWIIVSGEKNVEFSEVVNFELIRAGVNVSRLSYTGNNLFSVISGESGVVMSVVLSSKEMKVLAGKGAGLGWIDTVISKDKAYVLTKGGVFVAGNESNSLIFDTAVTDPVGMSVFGSSLYVLEKGNKEVFKYSITDTGFGERQRWLKEGQSISSTPLDMDIDVDVWVLEQGNILERFRRGVKESFLLSGLPKEIEVEKVSVEIEGDRIALLSPKQSMVVLCSKETGVCEKQLKNDKLVDARDISFGEQGMLYVLLKSSVGVLN